MAQIDLKKSIKKVTFFTSRLMHFGGKQATGDQFIFDRRGAVRITDKQIRKQNGEIVKIRSVADAGTGYMGADPIAIPRPTSGSSVDASKALESNHGWVYSAIKAIADEMANTEFRVYKTGKDGEHEEVMEHDLIDFLDAVNDFQTGPEFKHLMTGHLETTGNAYILLLGKNGLPVKTFEETPQSMHLLDPSRVKIMLDKTTYPFKITSYQFVIESRTFTYLPEQIVHIKWPDPANQYQGIGTVQGVAEWIDNDNNSTEFIRQFFLNGAQIGKIFETDMTSEEQLQELKDSYDEQHASVKNAWKALFLPKGVKKPTDDSKFGDIGFANISDSNRDKILAGFRVSKTILGTAESDTNRATAETADYVFAKRTIRPKMQLICSYLNEFLVPRFGDDIFLTFVDPVPEDKQFRSNEMKNATGGVPVITVDEARQEFLGLGPIEGGDKLLVPTNYTATGETPMELPTDGAKKVKPSTVKLGYVPASRKRKTQFARNAEIRKETSKSLAEAIASIISVQKKSIKDITDEEYENVILKDKRDRIHGYSEKMQAALRKVNDEQKKEVLANLENATKSVKAVDPKKFFNLDKWINITVEALKPIADEMFAKEADHALQLIDKPGLDIENTPSAKRALQHAMDLMSQSYNQNTVDLLEAKLNEGLSQGYSVDKLADLVQDIYAWKDSYAAERVALTESNRITNMAGKIAWKESGVVKQLEWFTSKRDNVCEFCNAQDGEVIDIDDNFYDKGDTVKGEDGGTMEVDYSDIGGPPLHPNCHCGMKPVVDTSIEAAAKPAVEKEVTDALTELEALQHDHVHE